MDKQVWEDDWFAVRMFNALKNTGGFDPPPPEPLWDMPRTELVAMGDEDDG